MKDTKFIYYIAIIIFYCFTQSISVAKASIKAHHYRALFENGNIYELTITNDQFSWRGLSGPEKGKVQIITDYRHVNVADRVEVLQWVAETGAFNTAILDYDQLRIVSTGQHKKATWFWHGRLEKLSV